jgi:hypothetical protein
MSDSDAGTWMTVAGLVGVALHAALSATLLVVALTTVRQHRRDVVGLLATSAVISLVATCSSPLVTAGGAAISARSGIERFVQFQALTGVCFALVHVAAFGLLLGAIVRLAKRPREEAREGPQP